MIREVLARAGIYTSTGWHEGYDAGYHQGLEEGGDFGKRVAHNQTLRHELPGILSRYSQLQVKLITKPKKEMQEALEKFQTDELRRLEMELQNR